MDMETIIMNLVVNSGDARSVAIEALREARDGNFAKADEMMEHADQIMLQGHESQTEMIQSEINGGKIEVSLLMVHAQDHLMNAMTVIDLCKEIIDILRKQANA